MIIWSADGLEWWLDLVLGSQHLDMTACRLCANDLRR